MAAGYSRSTGQVGVALVTSGPGRHQHGHAGARLHGRLDPHGGDLRPGAARRHRLATPSRKRPIAAVMGAVAKHVFLVTDPDEARRHRSAPRSSWRAPAGPGRWSSTSRRTCRTGRASTRAAAWLPSIGVYQKRMQRAGARSRIPSAAASPSSRCWAASRRPLIYAGGGVIHADASPELREFAELFGIPVVTTLMGIGAVDTTRPLSHAHARHARHGVRQLRGRGLRFPDRARRALRRPRGRQSRRSSRRARGTSRSSTSIRPRSTRSSRCSGITSAT